MDDVLRPCPPVPSRHETLRGDPPFSLQSVSLQVLPHVDPLSLSLCLVDRRRGPRNLQ